MPKHTKPVSILSVSWRPCPCTVEWRTQRRVPPPPPPEIGVGGAPPSAARRCHPVHHRRCPSPATRPGRDLGPIPVRAAKQQSRPGWPIFQLRLGKRLGSSSSGTVRCRALSQSTHAAHRGTRGGHGPAAPPHAATRKANVEPLWATNGGSSHHGPLPLWVREWSELGTPCLAPASRARNAPLPRTKKKHKTARTHLTDEQDKEEQFKR